MAKRKSETARLPDGIEVVDLASLTSDPKNANKGTPRGMSMLEDSLQEDGAGRGILVSADGVVLAGNKTWEKAGEVGFEKVIVVPTDGKTLVATKRMDVRSDDPKAVRMAIRDNRSGELDLSWSPEVLAALAEEDGKLLDGLWREDELAELLATIASVPLTEGEESLPDSSQLTTCPKCGFRF